MSGSPTRTTRAERQAQTRERLIEVARRLFLEDGYATTSLEKVALEAGFSKGAVYSNFSGKEELCLAVLDSIHAEQVEGVVTAFATPGDLDAKIDAFSVWARRGLGRPRWTALEVELAAAARHSSYVAKELIKRHRELVAATATLIKTVTDAEGLELTVDPHEAATILLSLGIGLGALRSLDQQIDVTLFATAMKQMLPAARVQ